MRCQSISSFHNFKLKLLVTTLTALLSACGGSSSSNNNTTPVTPSNTTPVANAGVDQSVSVGETVTLDGALSSDADADTLTYTWAFTSIPSDSDASVQNPTNVQPSFVVDIAGDYTLTLIVNDGSVDSTADTVTVTASANNAGVTDITDAIFSSTLASCDAYVGSYASTVTDINRGITFSGDTTISSDNNTCTFTSNEIPNHDFNNGGGSFANDVSEQNSAYAIPTNPEFAAQSSALSLRQTNAIFLNGVVVDLLAAACYDVGNESLGNEKIGCGETEIDNPWRYDPMSPLNNFATDLHNAHAQPDGTYHYHGNPLAMFDQDCDINATASPIIGFAADGFPIYGSCFTDPVTGSVRKAESSYALKDSGGPRQEVAGYTTPAAGQGTVASANYDGQFTGDYQYEEDLGDLDECNGMSIEGQYGYYVTNSYPWVLGCYKGTTDSSFTKSGTALQNRMHSHGDESHTH